MDAVRERVPNYFPDKINFAISVLMLFIDILLTSWQELEQAASASRVAPIGRDTTQDEVAAYLVSAEEANTITGARLLEFSFRVT